MGNKLIFIGPPGAGKTTLRKIFFEGENTKKLLEYALEPTYGEESIILRLPKIHEEIGIFDLAGQENERWLESEERAIFLDTNIILGVMDVTAEIDAIIEFITKILKIRNEVTPSAFVYILLHKIDLISFKKLERLKDEIKFKFIDAKQTKFFFTSLKREFFYQTFSCFLQIIKKSISTEEEGESTAILNVLEENFNLIKIIDEEIIISKEELARKLNKPVAIIDILLRNLEKKGYVKVENVENQKLISLTDEGKNNNKNIYTTLLVFPENITSQISIEEKEVAKKEKYPFIGAFVADKNGKLLFKIENEKDAIKQILMDNFQQEEGIPPLELDLIPMFISALEKFSKELNIRDLVNLELGGTNLKLNVFSYEDFTVTFFMYPDVNIKAVEYEIRGFFDEIFEEYREQLNYSIQSGYLDNLEPIINKCNIWLKELNKKYNNMLISYDLIDMSNAKDLFIKIDELYAKISTKSTITLEKIKKLKVDLMKAMLSNDFDEIKKISKKANEISSNFLF